MKGFVNGSSGLEQHDAIQKAGFVSKWKKARLEVCPCLKPGLRLGNPKRLSSPFGDMLRAWSQKGEILSCVSSGVSLWLYLAPPSVVRTETLTQGFRFRLRFSWSFPVPCMFGNTRCSALNSHSLGQRSTRLLGHVFSLTRSSTFTYSVNSFQLLGQLVSITRSSTFNHSVNRFSITRSTFQTYSVTIPHLLGQPLSVTRSTFSQTLARKPLRFFDHFEQHRRTGVRGLSKSSIPSDPHPRLRCCSPHRFV